MANRHPPRDVELVARRDEGLVREAVVIDWQGVEPADVRFSGCQGP